MKTRTTRIATAATVAAAAATVAVGLVTPTAGAATPAPHDLSKAKARCVAAVDKRVTTLATAQSRLASAPNVTAGHKSALGQEMSADSTGLTALKAKISADTTATDLKSDCKKVFTDYRVFALEIPKVRLVARADRGEAAITKALAQQPRLDAAIAKAQQRGVSAEKIADAKAKEADAVAKLHAAHDSFDAVAGSVMPLTPAQWNDGTAKPVLAHARDSVKTAVGDLKAARGDVRAIRADLRK